MMACRCADGLRVESQQFTASAESAIITIGVVFVQLAVDLAKSTFSSKGQWDAAAEASSVMFFILPVPCCSVLVFVVVPMSFARWASRPQRLQIADVSGMERTGNRE